MQNLIQCLSSEHNYKFLKSIKENIEQNDDQSLTLVIQTVTNILQNQQSQPLQKVLSVRLIKELMDLHQQQIVQTVGESQILFEFEKVAEFDFAKGVYYFAELPDESLKVLGNTFVRLICECIFVWNIWHPSNQFKVSPFSQCYLRLQQKGVQFPKLYYFNSQKVREYYLVQKEGLIKTQKSAYFQNSQQELMIQEFQELKKKLELSSYTIQELNEIIEHLLRLNHLKQPQELFIQSISKAYEDYKQFKCEDDLKINIQAICMEYDEQQCDGVAALEALQQGQASNIKTPSKISKIHPVYSSDNQFLSNGSFSSQNSTPKNVQRQMQILNEKNKKIETLLALNSQLGNQIMFFEKSIQNLKRNSVSITNSKDNSYC